MVTPRPMALLFTSNRRCTARNRAISTSTTRGAQRFHTRERATSFSQNRNLRAIGCLARILGKDCARIARIVAAIFAVLFVPFSSDTLRRTPQIGSWKGFFWGGFESLTKRGGRETTG